MLRKEFLKNYNNEYVYDISLDGTVVNALGMNVISNTDGFNFVIDKSDEIRARKYIGKGLNRNTVEGKEYVGPEADVAEFNDLFMRNKMGLGIDEIIYSNLILARKNYADLMDVDTQVVKFVGNTIKSKGMPLYIENFINEGLRLLLNDKGYEFLQLYYDYIEKIYNFKIPLNEIASKGRIKRTINEYIEYTQELTTAGNKKARQAWYELVIQNKTPVSMGDTIYYVNVGEKSTVADVKRETHFYQSKDGDVVDITKDIKREWNKYRREGKKDGLETTDMMKIKPYSQSQLAKDLFGEEKITDDDVITLNCVMLDKELVESEDGDYVDESIEYNAAKYIKQFNDRIKALLVCFHPDIREDIIIDDPRDRKDFVRSKTQLTSGYPNKPSDQDTMEQLLTMEDKEIEFWLSIDKIPPFIDEIGMDWEWTVRDYNERMVKLEIESIKNEKSKYNELVSTIPNSAIDKMIEEGVIPPQLSSFLKVDLDKMKFISKKHDTPIGSIYDLIERNVVETSEDF